jgi:uncharacterized protein (TIGR02246 family)
MSIAAADRRHLEDLVVRFTEAFNRDDLDAVMSFFADDAIYDEFNGVRHHGREAIRTAFVPQFRGDFGTIRFLTEDLFVDAETGKALIRWECRLSRGGTTRAWRGLDILRFDGDRLLEKHTYAKAKKLQLAPR